MNDRRSLVLNFIYWECKRRSRRGSRRYIIGQDRVNARMVADEAKIDRGNLSRIIRGHQGVSDEVVDKLAAWADFATRSNFWAEAEESRKAPRGAFGRNYP